MTAEREVWREALGVVIATSAYGVSFGALAVASGLDVWQTCVLSLLMFTGGSQFAFVGVFTAGGLAALPSAVASAALLGVRNVAYGMRMSSIVGGGPVRKAAAAHFTIDESTAVGVEPRIRTREPAFESVHAAVLARQPITFEYRRADGEVATTL